MGRGDNGSVITRPVVRYYGGKFKLAPWITSFFPEHRVYIEPFGGGGSVLMHKRAAAVEIYNDLNSEMYNLFVVLRDEKMNSKLKQQLELTPYSRQEWLDAYEDADPEDKVEQARRTIIRCTMSHNPSKVLNRLSNGFRCASTGEHRLADSFQKATEYLPIFAKRLKQVILENRDASDVMIKNDGANTLHYVDPPYLQSLRKDKRNLYQVELKTDDEHYQLSKVLKALKGMVILSGYPCKQYDEWYTDAGWVLHSIKAVTGASKKGESTATECIWLNPLCAERQLQISMF